MPSQDWRDQMFCDIFLGERVIDIIAQETVEIYPSAFLVDGSHEFGLLQV